MYRVGLLITSLALLISGLASAVPRASATDSTPEHDLRGYPSTEEVGFQHLALLYHDDNTSAESYLPYVNRVATDGSVAEYDPLFDAFLMLSFTAPTGASMDYGKLTVEDWRSTLDLWFGPNGDLSRLNRAVELASEAHGVTDDTRKVVVMMPWMSAEQRDFGDLGDGAGSRDLTDPSDRRAVATWFTQLVADEFAAAELEHLDLWGMYRMREDLTPWERALLGPGDTPVAAADAQGVHDVDPDLGYLFIPYYNAPGWAEWQAYGFTAAIMQPSYAFRGVMDGGRVDAGRLRATAHRAAEHGLGVEIEVRGCQEMPQEQAVLRGYLAAGTTYGYQQAPNAYFLGANLATCGAVTSSDPGQRAAYDALADYVTGAPIGSPDIEPEWTRTRRAHAYTWTATDVDTGDATGLRIDLTEPDLAAAWRGTAQVYTRESGDLTWQPAGWSVRGAPDNLAGAHQSFSVPITQDSLSASGVDVKVVLTSAPGSPVATPRVDNIVLDPGLGTAVANPLAQSPVVTEAPEPAPGKYPDPDGTKLTDGVVSTEGWTEAIDVGWTSDPGQAAVVVDLGAERAVDQVRIHAQGGSDAGVNWPLNPSVLLGSTAPAAAPEGPGTKPGGLQAIPFGQPVVTGRHASGIESDLPLECGDDGAPTVLCTNQDGYLDARSVAPVESRYVTVFLGTSAWAMLSEIEIFAGGDKITPAGYRMYRLPNGDDEQYVDDGLRLTDGQVADDFKWRMFSGWPGDKPVTLRLDLPAKKDISSVTLWSADLPALGIVPPSEFSVEVTTDGQSWSPYTGTVSAEELGRAGRRLVLTGAKTVTDVTGLRISISGDHADWNWHMLSEITTTPG